MSPRNLGYRQDAEQCPAAFSRMNAGAPFFVLTIAGSDSGGGAGVQADSRTIRDLGGHALNAITAVTAQNTCGVRSWRRVSAKLLSDQLCAVLEDFPVGAAKTGLLPGAREVRLVAETLPSTIPLVVDPVVASTSGTRFLSRVGLRRLRDELLPRAALVTPNWPEAAQLAEMPVRNREEAEKAAGKILSLGCGAVLLKGGHEDGNVCRDFLIQRDTSPRIFEHPRIESRNLHGTGCVLSAAIAAGLAEGKNAIAAVESAVAYLQERIIASRGLSLGKGRGPCSL